MAAARARRCTAPIGRPTRWPRCGVPARRWPTSSASTPVRRCGSSRRRCSRSRPALGPAATAAAGAQASPAGNGPATQDGLVDRTASSPHSRHAGRPRRRGLACCSSRVRPGSARPGCWPRRAGWRPSDPCACSSARGSELESAFAFGVVRQLFEPEVGDPAAREELLRGAAAGARGCSTSPTAAAPRASPSCTGCTGWRSTSRPSGPAGAARRRRAVVRRRLAALPGLPRPPARRGTGAGGGGRAHRRANRTTRTCSPSSRSNPRRSSSGRRRCPLEATAELVARRLGVRPAPLFVDRLPPDDAGNPLLLRQLLRALAADGVRPDAAHADRVVAVGSRAVSSMVLRAAAPAARGRRGRRPGCGGARRRGRPAGGRGAGRAPRDTHRGSARRAGPGRDRERRAAGVLRPPARPRRGLPGAAQRPSGACATSGPRRLLRAARRERRAGGGTPAAGADPR